MKIQDIYAREIFDSRGIPTIECDLFLSDGMMVTSSVPSGTSCGMYEAIELRDGGDRLRGMGVQKAISMIENIIAPILIDRSPDLVTMDKELISLDQTINKSYLGSNSILAISMAICKAQAYIENLELYEFIAYISDYSTVELPYPMFNVLGGGLHESNNFPIQEILIVPTKNFSFHEVMEVGLDVFYNVKNILKSRRKSVAIGLEGGFVSSFKDVYEALDILMEAIFKSNNSDGIMIAFDIAASYLYDTTSSRYNWFGNHYTSEELIEEYVSLVNNYPIYSIEDGLDQSDWQGWTSMKQVLGERIKIIGDDLFVTNAQRIWHGIEKDCATTVLIKPNQIGTVTEALQAVMLCKDNEWDVIVSHRSGETNDSFIADLAVGVSASHIKAGGCHNGERMAKYNRLLIIEENIVTV